MKTTRDLPSPWPGGKKAKLKYESAIPPRDWKYWSMLAMSAAWFTLLTFMLLKANNAPNVAQYWKDRSALEQTQNKANPPAAPKAGATAWKQPFAQKDGFYQVGFNTLASFPSETPALIAGPKDQPGLQKKFQSEVPPAILEMDGQKVSVAGFMIPMEVNDKGRVSSFILAQNQMTCCYGVFPKLNQWVYVTMAGEKTVDSTMDIPLTVFGTLGVGTQYDQDSQGWCLYRMTCEKLDLPKKTWFGF